MTKQITNMIDAGMAYERIMRVIGKLHRAIRVVITETEKPWWRQKVTTTVITVESQKDATQVQQFLCKEIGGKEIAVELSLI